MSQPRLRRLIAGFVALVLCVAITIWVLRRPEELTLKIATGTQGGTYCPLGARRTWIATVPADNYIDGAFPHRQAAP